MDTNFGIGRCPGEELSKNLIKLIAGDLFYEKELNPQNPFLVRFCDWPFFTKASTFPFLFFCSLLSHFTMHQHLDIQSQVSMQFLSCAIGYEILLPE